MTTCCRCEGSGEIGVKTSLHQGERPGPVPDDARGWFGVRCPDCNGSGIIGKPPTPCAQCGTIYDVRYENSRTCYHFDGEIGGPDDPNKPIRLCRSCALEHHAHWDSLWADYYGDKL